MSEIQTASPAARRKAAWIIVLGVLIGALPIALYSYFEEAIYEWLYHNFELVLANTFVVFLLTLIMFTPLILFAAYLFVYGRRIVAARRMPPPGYAVVRDTKVVTDSRAIRLGLLVQFLSLLIIAAGIVTPFYFWYVLSQMASTQ